MDLIIFFSTWALATLRKPTNTIRSEPQTVKGHVRQFDVCRILECFSLTLLADQSPPG